MSREPDMIRTQCRAETVALSQDEARDVFDQVVRREMGIAGAEFLRRWDAGEWADVDLDDVPGLGEVRAFLAFAR